eukprot:scaffold8628_cov111-Isochrysis_galbana.AAC.2
MVVVARRPEVRSDADTERIPLASMSKVTWARARGAAVWWGGRAREVGRGHAKWRARACTRSEAEEWAASV